MKKGISVSPAFALRPVRSEPASGAAAGAGTARGPAGASASGRSLVSLAYPYQFSVQQSECRSWAGKVIRARERPQETGLEPRWTAGSRPCGARGRRSGRTERLPSRRGRLRELVPGTSGRRRPACPRCPQRVPRAPGLRLLQPPGHSPLTTFITQSPPCGEGPSPGPAGLSRHPAGRGWDLPAAGLSGINRGGAAGRIRLTLQKGSHGRHGPRPRQQHPIAVAGRGLVPLLLLQLLGEELGRLCQG